MAGLRPIRYIGAGFIGATGGAAYLRAGHQVTLVDTNPVVLSRLRERVSSDVRKAVGHALEPYLRTGQLQLVTDWRDGLAEGTVLFVAVPTERRGRPWMEPLHAWWRDNFLKDDERYKVAAVVVESTVVPGTLDEMALAAEGKLEHGAPLVVAPRRDWFGMGQTIDKVCRVVGIRGLDTIGVRRLIASVSGQVVQGSYRAVELCKPLENALMYLPLAYALNIAWRYPQVDMVDAMALVSTHFARPTYELPAGAMAGYCVPPAPWYVADEGMAEAAWCAENDALDQLGVLLEGWGKRFLFLGLGYKPDCGLLTRSPAVATAKRLIDGGREVFVLDPLYHPDEIAQAVPGAGTHLPEHPDVAVLWVGHRQFIDQPIYREFASRAPIVLDACGAWECYGATFDPGQYRRMFRAGWRDA